MDLKIAGSNPVAHPIELNRSSARFICQLFLLRGLGRVEIQENRKKGDANDKVQDTKRYPRFLTSRNGS